MIYVILILSFLNFSSAQTFDWQSHRGARGLYPENTVNAMKVALKYPQVTTLELDVVISKDHEIVVSHEPWMSEEICLDSKGRTVKDRAHNLYQMSYSEIVKFDCGSKPHPRFPEQKKVAEHKPKLVDLLSVMEAELKNLKKTGIKYSIEIKSLPEDEKAGFQPDIKTFTDKVMGIIQKKLPKDRYMIQSFDWRVLKYLHEKYPGVVLVALRETPYKARAVLTELGFRPEVFSPDFTLLTKEDIVFFKEHGVKVIPWTVNQTEEMMRLIKMGVDGIITDYPNRIPVSQK